MTDIERALHRPGYLPRRAGVQSRSFEDPILPVAFGDRGPLFPLPGEGPRGRSRASRVFLIRSNCYKPSANTAGGVK